HLLSSGGYSVETGRYRILPRAIVRHFREQAMTEDKVNILLVDDHAENLLALEALLSDLGQNLVRASSGLEALRLLLHQEFALILLDVDMPTINGFGTAALLRQRDRSHHTPIIFLTAVNTAERHVVKGYSIGAVDYLTKPFVPEILRSKRSEEHTSD